MFDERKAELEKIITDGEARIAEINNELEGARKELKAIHAANDAYRKAMGESTTKRKTGVKKTILDLLVQPMTKAQITEKLPDVKPGTLANTLSTLKRDGAITLEDGFYRCIQG